MATPLDHNLADSGHPDTIPPATSSGPPARTETPPGDEPPLELKMLFGAAAHDLRNPINVIKSATYFLKTKLTDMEPRLIRQLDLINRACGSLAGLIDDIDRFPGMQQRPTELTDVLQVVEELVEQLGDPGKRIRIQADDSLQPAALNEEFFRFGLRKLLQRALDLTPPEKPVALVIRTQGDTVEIQVHDSGPPLTDQKRLGMFHPEDVSPRDRSSNLPLVLVALMARAHNAEAGCNPGPDPSEGNIIWIRFATRTAE